MGKLKDGQFWESATKNKGSYIQYYHRLMELSISMFDWQNLPDTVDARFLELALFSDGMAIFFKDEALGFVALRTMIGGTLNVYQIPTKRKAYAANGYNNNLDETNSVIIFNNMLHTNSMLEVEQFSNRLYNLDRVIDVNANAQKTPILISCDETQRLTLMNLYKQFDGNMPVIYGDKNLNPNSLKVLTTGAPYIADKIYQLKVQIWNEALTYLGISNINITKKERLITDEVTRNQGGTLASRYSRLNERREACKKINDMFGLNIWCDFREDYQTIDNMEETTNAEEGEENMNEEGSENE